jgi:hypothetical protein
LTDPAFEALIQYRRQLRERQTVLDLSWGLTSRGLTLAQPIWHLTVGKEPPARSICGKELVKVVPRYMLPAGNSVCGRCKLWAAQG